MAISSFDVDKKYNVLQNIGKGSAGSVFLCKSKRDHKAYALKQIFLDKRKKSRSKEIVLREVLILQKLQHPHVVHYHEAFFDRKQDNLFIIQDYCAGGSLHEKVKTSKQKNTLIPERQIMEWFVQVTMALRYIHGKRVLHRDLKTQNVFLTKANMIKIGDFGIARVLEHTVDMASTCVGTPCYLSPEICQDKPYNSKSDIWALGCLLYELCSLKPAFNASNLVSLCYKIVKGKYEHIPDEYSNLTKMLIERSLQKCPEDRPTATTILNLPEVKEQLSVYITDKETERQSAHPAKRAAPAAPRNMRKTAKPSVVNIGGDTKKKVVKKGKKSPSNSGKAVKKKKKKSKNEILDAEEVKKLPDELVLSNRPDSPTVPPGRLQDPFKPTDDLPPIMKHNVVVGYSPPTICKMPLPAPAPKSYFDRDSKAFLAEYSTQTAEIFQRPQPSQSPTRPSTPPDPKPVSPTFTPSQPAVITQKVPLDSKTFHKAPPTPLFRIPKPDNPRVRPGVTSRDNDVTSRDNDVTSRDNDNHSESRQSDTHTEVDGMDENAHFKTMEKPISLTSPQITNSVLSRAEEGNITPLPHIPQEQHVVLPVQPAGHPQGFLPHCSDSSTLDTATDEVPLPMPFRISSHPRIAEAVTDAIQLHAGQVEVGWAVGDGTQDFTPARLQKTITETIETITTTMETILDNRTTVGFLPTHDSDDLNLNLDDVPCNQFPNIPEGVTQEKNDNKISEDEAEEEYSDDFEDYEGDEMPDYNEVEDIPDLTAPGEEDDDEDSDEEEDEMFEMAMKSARVALDNIEEEEDEEFVEDFVLPSSAGNIAALRQYCINMLGPDLFEEVQNTCREFEDNYDSHGTFVKKLENLAGSDKLEICLIVDEFFVED